MGKTTLSADKDPVQENEGEERRRQSELKYALVVKYVVLIFSCVLVRF